MSYDTETLRKIYAKTDGRCHICWNEEGVIYFNNYGKPGARGAWEVDHSLARMLGGTNHLNNLWPAHVGCNRSRKAESIRKLRSSYGYVGSPLSAEAKEKIRVQNARMGAVTGGLVGLAAGGPAGAFLGAAIGTLLGRKQDPEGRHKK